MIPSNYPTATETIALLAKGEIDLGRVLKDHQARTEQRDKEVRAWVRVDHLEAVDRTQEGPLRGMVIGVKDIISTSLLAARSNNGADSVDTQDFPTEYGSSIYKDNQTGQDAAAVSLLKFAGASIIGKTVRFSFYHVHIPIADDEDS